LHQSSLSHSAFIVDSRGKGFFKTNHRNTFKQRPLHQSSFYEANHFFVNPASISDWDRAICAR